MDERRSERRYVVKENASVWDFSFIKAGFRPGTIADISSHGMRLECDYRLVRGSRVAIDFRGMVVCGMVQYCRPLDGRFASGIQISDVLDQINGEAEDEDQRLDEELITAAPAADREAVDEPVPVCGSAQAG